ncbi:hypothetical protein BDV96DRAFT_224705 [Lophiotrema nucula]|uniref:Uncharacterized protein n=1 Tax=Lophiotrema nucula TaxID=690887 RepID=A0A6A5YSN7_9PLEO|nr:hypothetical protein BDV96DRAFT_224705 [Lophiotrema nucula]
MSSLKLITRQRVAESPGVQILSSSVALAAATSCVPFGHPASCWQRSNPPLRHDSLAATVVPLGSRNRPQSRRLRTTECTPAYRGYPLILPKPELGLGLTLIVLSLSGMLSLHWKRNPKPCTFGSAPILWWALQLGGSLELPFCFFVRLAIHPRPSVRIPIHCCAIDPLTYSKPRENFHPNLQRN